MRKRTLWVGLGVLAGLWIVPATFVALYGPGASPAPGRADARDSLDGGRASHEPQFRLLGPGYSKSWSVETWEGKDKATADVHRVHYSVERGPLDRRSGTYRFRLVCSMDHARDLEGARLFVTSVSDWSRNDGEIWTQVAETKVRASGAKEAALLLQAIVPASTTAYRLREIRKGVESLGFSQSMLTAPTFLGRVYDAIAWRWLFRSVPELR